MTIKLPWIISVSSVAMFAAGPLNAQEASTIKPAPISPTTSPPPPSDQPTGDAGEVGLADIVVTANKREQRLNDVGLTVQAATANTLVTRGVTDVASLTKIVPGFNATQSLYATPVYTLRGIGLYDSTFGAAPSVAIYTDELPRNVPVMSGALNLDLERVEVLKGPQGTTFGQSATGGAINYIVAKPTSALHAGGDFSYERFGLINASGFISGPLTDNLSARLAVGIKQGGAWQQSISRPRDVIGDQRVLEGRLSLQWNPTNRLGVYLSATGQRDRSDPLASQYTFSQFNIYSAVALSSANASLATRNPFAVVDNQRYTDLTNPSGPAFDPSFLGRQATLVRRLTGVQTSPSYPTLGRDAGLVLGSPRATNARQADWTQGFLRRNDNSYWQGAARIDYDLTDQIVLTSTTAFAKARIDYTTDLDATAAPNIDVTGSGSVRSFNQELRLQGDMAPVRWLLGVSHDNVRSTQNYVYNLTAYSGNEVIPGIILPASASSYTGRQVSDGVFANVEYGFTESLKITAGGRYTKNKISAAQCYVDPAADLTQGAATTFAILSDLFRGQAIGTTKIAPDQCFVLGNGLQGTTLNAPTLAPFASTLKEENWSFRVGPSYKFADGTLIYATISQGFKAGLYSAISPSTVDQYTPARQEKVVAYEAGLKAPLAGKRIQINLSGFYYDYSDKQVRARVLDPVFGLLEKALNVPKSYVWGLEGEVTASPLNGFNLRGGATYLKSKVTDSFSTTPDGRPIYNNQGYTGDFAGSALPFTPKLSVNADAEYEWQIGELRPLVGASVNYMGDVNATFENNVLRADLFQIGSYATVDLRAGIADSPDRWRVTVFARNVFNKYYVVAKSSLLDTYFQAAGRPATYGVALRFRY